MRRLIYALSATTLIFAASTVYFARALHLERAHGGADSRAAASPAPAGPGGTGAGGIPRSPLSGSSAGTAASKSVQAATAPATEGVNVVSRASSDPSRMLAKMTDPAQRQAMIDERKSSYRSFYPGLAEYLHMDEAEFERFTETVANHELAMQEAHLRCYIEKNCDAQALSGLVEGRQRELNDLFGSETANAFEYYQRTMGERQLVSQLRGRLPDKLRLMDAQAEALINALHEESQRIRTDAQQRGVQLGNFNNLIYTAESATPGADEEQQAAVVYNRMLRDRAATVLTADQLAIYTAMQNDAMQSYRSMQVNRDR